MLSSTFFKVFKSAVTVFKGHHRSFGLALTLPDKRVYLVIIRDNFYEFCLKIYVVTPHLNYLNETVQMRGYIGFR